MPFFYEIDLRLRLGANCNLRAVTNSASVSGIRPDIILGTCLEISDCILKSIQAGIRIHRNKIDLSCFCVNEWIVGFGNHKSPVENRLISVRSQT